MAEFWSALTAVSTFGLCVITAFAASYALRTVNQARTDSINRVRPILNLQLVKASGDGGRALDVLITNTGQTSAFEALITIPEWDHVSGKKLSILGIVGPSFSLAPGQTLKFTWIAEDGHDCDREGRMTVEVSYSGVLYPDRMYREIFQLDSSLTIAPCQDPITLPLRRHKDAEQHSPVYPRGKRRWWRLA